MIICPAVNQLGKLRDDLDANLTYEGDNNIILLQSSNYLFDVYEKKKAGTCLTCGGKYSRQLASSLDSPIYSMHMSIEKIGEPGDEASRQ